MNLKKTLELAGMDTSHLVEEGVHVRSGPGPLPIYAYAIAFQQGHDRHPPSNIGSYFFTFTSVQELNEALNDAFFDGDPKINVAQNYKTSTSKSVDVAIQDMIALVKKSSIAADMTTFTHDIKLGKEKLGREYGGFLAKCKQDGSKSVYDYVLVLHK